MVSGIENARIIDRADPTVGLSIHPTGALPTDAFDEAVESQVSVPTGSATQILAGDSSRAGAIIYNAGVASVRVGGSGVSSSIGLPLGPGDYMRVGRLAGELYAVALTVTCVLDVLEMV